MIQSPLLQSLPLLAYESVSPPTLAPGIREQRVSEFFVDARVSANEAYDAEFDRRFVVKARKLPEVLAYVGAKAQLARLQGELVAARAALAALQTGAKVPSVRDLVAAESAIVATERFIIKTQDAIEAAHRPAMAALFDLRDSVLAEMSRDNEKKQADAVARIAAAIAKDVIVLAQAQHVACALRARLGAHSMTTHEFDAILHG